MAGKKIYFGILLTIFGVSVARLVVLYSNDTTQLLQSHDVVVLEIQIVN